MTNTIRIYHFYLIISLFFIMPFAVAEEDSKYFTFTFENDAFVGEDNGYTNGIGLTFRQGPFLDFNSDNLPSWLHRLTQDWYISQMEGKTRGIANMYFQRMQTSGGDHN